MIGKKMFRFLGVSIAAALLVPSAVSAAPVSLTRSQHVSYADLDLTAAAGRAEFRSRLSAAANNVCRNDDEENFSSEAMYDCRRASWLRALKQFKLATDYAMRGGGSATLLAAR